MGGDRGRQLGRRDRERDEVVAGELEIGRARTGCTRVGQVDAGQVALVDAGGRRAGRPARGCGSRGRPRCPARASMTAIAVPHEPPPMTAARRSGGRPPSHSHCSITLGQMRSVTAAASCAVASSTCGKRSGLPMRTRILRGRMRQPLRIASVPIIATGTTGAPVSSASRPTPRLGLPSAPGRMRVPSGKISTGSPRSRIAFAVSTMSVSAVAAADREGAERADEPAEQPVVEQLLLGHVVDRAPAGRARR